MDLRILGETKKNCLRKYRLISMYVLGIGRTKFGTTKKTLATLMYDAMLKALEDAKIRIRDINVAYVSNFGAALFENQVHLNSILAGLLPSYHIPIIRIEAACAAGGAAFYTAYNTIDKFEKILVIGVEKMSGLSNLQTTSNIASAGDVLLDQTHGLIFPGSYALCARQHMKKYGTTLDDMALVSLKNHKNANLNELSHFYHKNVSLEEIKASPMICSPLRLYDCCPISDGAVAVILSKEKKDDRSVEILESTLSTDSISLVQRRSLTSFLATKTAVKEAYKKADIKPSDIDIAEVHDCFTIAELIALEDLGFCKPGESKNMIRQNQTNIDGKIPVNTDGGLKADGHPIGATGLAQIFEIVTQLRGEAGSRQVGKAEIGLTHNIGGVGGTCVINILRM